LVASLHWLQNERVDRIQSHEADLCAELLEGLDEINEVTVYGKKNAILQTATVALNIEGLEPSSVGFRLDEEFGIMCRVGLHCAPAAHRTIGTFPDGCVRISLGAFNTHEEIQILLKAVRQMAGGH